MGELPRDWPFRNCETCGHGGFSHDNAFECAECECEEFRYTDPTDPTVMEVEP